MALLLPGESRNPRLLEVVVAVAAVIGLCALGCATPTRTRRMPSVWRSMQQHDGLRVAIRRPPLPQANRDESATVVAASLHKAGLRFGTDGSTRALWGYLSTTHDVVSPPYARPGDFVFFDTRGGANADPECADHVGVVQKVDASGRITFVEARGGTMRTSYVTPSLPLARRDGQGEILNSFLRAKKISDPPEARYFAGEMLCGIARVSSR